MGECDMRTGSFTLPGESGYEELTLRLAAKWGADTIRDSDGTQLSPALLDSPYDIYSTLCLVRADNAWAKANPDKLQQNYLMSRPALSNGGEFVINLLAGYFQDQFRINLTDNPAEWWQVFDRTTGEELSTARWIAENDGKVRIAATARGHVYTVNFLVYRLWEEISMYNHITNAWGDKERLLAVEPRHPETQAHLLAFLEDWLKAHPATKIVRFTSLFYNFAWFWGDETRQRFRYGDWGSYDFTVNPIALREFEKARGYRLKSEDFVNGGFYNATHNPPTARYRDWMDFINEFVVRFGRACVDLVHRYGKKAYLFYDDHWIGTEPYGERFQDLGMDGIIKCVFNGFEARLGAGVPSVKVHELRLHPYLFPTGLKGEPTFKAGGNPTLDAKRFWSQIRRALLRAPVDRIGLGGYLHLVEPFPDFQDYIEALAQEFRLLKSFHSSGAPYVLPFKIAILSVWGKLRSWICSGHLHEHPEIELTHILESLSGLPFNVEFLSLDEVAAGGVPTDVKIVINAGRAGSAWSGGDAWRNPRLVSALTTFVMDGGALLGVGEPSAVAKAPFYFQLAPILGVDEEIGRSICANKYQYAPPAPHFITADLSASPDFGEDAHSVFVTDGATEVLADAGPSPRITVRRCGRGRAVYFSGFRHSSINARLLHRALCWAAGAEAIFQTWTCEDSRLEAAYYPGETKLVVINNSEDEVASRVIDAAGRKRQILLPPLGIMILEA